jgi:hypothetical protein
MAVIAAGAFAAAPPVNDERETLTANCGGEDQWAVNNIELHPALELDSVRCTIVD